MRPPLSSQLSDPLSQRILILLLILLAYANSFSVPFHFDDADYVIANPMTRDLRFYTEPSSVSGVQLSENVSRARHSRILVLLSFWANHAIGGLDVRGYHVFNLLVHMGCAMFLYGLLGLTLRSPFLRPASGGALAYLPLLGTLIFALHPANTIAVTYITQRFASMVTLFMLGSLWAYARWRLNGRLGHYALSMALAVLAMKTKEPAFMLPVVMGLYEAMFFEGRAKDRILALLPFVLFAGLVPLAHLAGGGDIASAMAVNQEISRHDYILTELRVLVSYLRIFILPIGLLIDYEYPIYRSMSEPAVLGSLALHLSIAGLSVWVWAKGQARALRLAAFGALCFYITLVVESGLVPLGDVIFEYRMYLPSAFALPALAAIALAIMDLLPSQTARRASTAAIMSIVLALGLMTFIRNMDWQKESTIWAQVVERYPERVRARNNLCNALYLEGQSAEALPHCERSLELDPYNNEALYNLALIRIEQGRPEDAIKSLDPLLVMKAGNADIQYAASRAYALLGNAANAELYRQKAIALAPERAESFPVAPTAAKKLAH